MSTVTTIIQAQDIVNQGIFKANPMSSRFDASKISPNIAEAERRFLKTFINIDFYNDLIAEKNTLPCNYNIDLGPIVLAYPTNALYETLWTQHLFPFLSRAAYYESLLGIVIQIGSNGAFLNNTEYGENIGIKGLKFLRDESLETLKGMQPPIIEFLCENKASYTLWDSTGYCDDCDDSKNTLGRNAGFVFR